MRKFSVLLLHPDEIIEDQTDFITNAYLAHVEANNKPDAIKAGKMDAADETGNDPNEFDLLAVFEGWVETI